MVKLLKLNLNSHELLFEILPEAFGYRDFNEGLAENIENAKNYYDGKIAELKVELIILFAKRLSDFGHLGRKAIRIVQYDGNNRYRTLKDDTQDAGYAVTFENIIRHINALLPSVESFSGALRERISVYPELAIRETVGNALIHQDFSVTGTGPAVEIFSNRIEITNSGTPLIDIKKRTGNNTWQFSRDILINKCTGENVRSCCCEE